MSRFKIYTKTGDEGSSSLYNGERRSKDDAIFQALGDVDELNSAVGLARDAIIDAGVSEQLEVIQSRLLDAGSAVATPAEGASAAKLKRVAFGDGATEHLENWVDAMDEALPALSSFILPSGGRAASCLHMARSICRRAERSVTTLVAAAAVDASVAIYLNRLSDYLFTAARFMAQADGQPEVVYRKAAA